LCQSNFFVYNINMTDYQKKTIKYLKDKLVANETEYRDQYPNEKISDYINYLKGCNSSSYKESNTSSNAQVSNVPGILALVGLILGCIGAVALLGNAISFMLFYEYDYYYDDSGNIIWEDVTHPYMGIGILMIFLSLIVLATSIVFFILFKKIEKDTKKHTALCVCGIIFGGLFVLIGSIICLCDGNRKNT